MSQRIAKKPVEVIITRPDGSEVRFVKGAKKNYHSTASGAAVIEDEDTRVVEECATYTASFNNLLSEVRPQENPLRLVELVHARMKRESIPLNTTTYNLLMKRLIPFKESPIFSLYEELKTEGMKKGSSVQPDLETFRILFRSCERNANYNKTFLLYQQMRELFHLLPDTSMYNALLGYCAAVHDVAQATYFMEEMKENGVEMDANTYNCFMSVLVDSAPYSETLRVFREMSDTPKISPTLRTYNTVLKAARVNDDYDKAFQVFEEMKKKGVVPDIVTYNILLWLCEQRLDYINATGKYETLSRTEEQKREGKAALVELVLVLFSDIKSMRISPNTFSYNKLLSVLYQCEDFRVFTVYDEMREIVGKQSQLAKNGNDGQEALGSVFTETNPQENSSILGSTVYLNKETFIIIIKAYLALGYPERCKAVVQTDMETSGVVLDKEMTTLLWDVCSITKDKEWADQILSQVKEKSGLFEVPLYNHYLAVLAAVGEPALFRYFEEMKIGIHPLCSSTDTETYNIVLGACVNNSDVEKGLEVWESLVNPYSPVKPNSDSYCLFFALYEVKKEVGPPLKLFESLVEQTRADNVDGKKRVVPRKVVQRLLRMFVALRHEYFEELFTKVKSHAVAELPVADVETYSIAMRFYYEQEKWDMVQQLFNEVKTSSVLDVNLECYEVMLNMLHDRNDLKGLKRVFEHAQMSNIKLSIKVYNKLIELAVSAESETFFFDILQDMKLREVRVGESTMSVMLSSSFGRKMLTEALKRNLILQFTESD